MPRRRGAILAIVLLVIAATTLAATAALFFASAQRASVGAASRRTQSRAIAWSAVQAVMDELGGQREALLRGQKPRLAAQRDVYGPKSGVGEHGLYRLMGEAVPESGRLDANSATTETLVRAGLSPGLAAEIGASRRERLFGSVRELTNLPVWASEGAPGKDPLALLTVFSFDPRVQSGAASGSGSQGGAGRGRLDLSGGWSPKFEEGVTAALGRDLAQAIRPVMGSVAAEGKPAVNAPGSMGELAQRLLAAGIAPKDIGRVLDVCCVGEPTMSTGLVSVNDAPAGVLAALPGMDAETARRVVSVREQLGDDDRASLGWLLERQVVTPAQFAALADVVATRCLQWRVVIESGISSSGEAESALRDRVVLEAVIDVSDERARVAYLRDVTMLPAAGWLDAMALRADKIAGAQGERAGSDREATTPASPAGTGGPIAPPPSSGGDGGPKVQAPGPPSPPSRRGSGASRVGRWTTGGTP